MKNIRWFLAATTLALVTGFACQPAKDALSVADGVCRVVNVVDPQNPDKTVQQVIDVADEACRFVQIFHTVYGQKVVTLVPKELVTREAVAYRRLSGDQVHDGGAE